MKRTALRTLPLVAAAAAIVGCQSAPKFAWWKQDKAAENSAVASNSKTPALPSSQSTPQAIAMAGATPPTASLAATTPAGATAARPNGTAAAPAVSIPVTSPTTPVANSAPAYPAENSLADKLVTTPNSKTALPASPTPGTAALAAAPSTPPMVTAGPYDPGAYKPSGATASTDPIGNTLDADRYAMASSTPPARPIATTPAGTSQSLASDPADRYGAPRTSTTPTGAPGQTPLTDPNALASDRYANPALPSLAGKTDQSVAANAAPVAAPAPPAAASSVKLASAPGQYRPGGTSSYNAVSETTSPVEIASRPSPPSTTDSAPATGGQSWTPGATSTAPSARPY